MSMTNFAVLTTEQKTVWSLDFWRQARNMSFINRFLGKDENALIQHVTELKKTEKGARAVLTLLTDLEGDGIAGDRNLEGNEEQLKSYDRVIRIDQLRNANRNEGRLADQKTVVNFRENSRDKLAYWISDRMDQLGFLTLAGLNYSTRNSAVGLPGGRVGSDLPFLEFAADVVAPSSKRFGHWNGTTKLMEWGTGTTTMLATDTPSYAMLVQAKAYAKDNYIRGVKEKGGEEVYHVFLSPQAMAKLKLDSDYIQNLRYAQKRGDDNPLFTGDAVKIDGLYLHEFRHVPNTRLTPSGSKYGATGTIDGCQILFCGAQAMGMADIGIPEWVEKGFDYENQQGISIGKILGFHKPQFYSQYSGGTTEDFGVLSLYTAQ
jgi:N4-gp56 family major capsid protein